MSYIGNNLQVAYPSYRVIDDISSGFNGVLKTFALRVAGSTPIPFPINPQQCLLSVNNIVQKPDSTGASGFTLTGSNIVFATAPTAGWSFFGTVLAGADYVNVGANFPSGTAAVPSVTFDESTGTGLFLASANVLGITTGGVQRLVVNSSGFVGIGTSSPNALLQINKGSTAAGIATGTRYTIPFAAGADNGQAIDLGLETNSGAKFASIQMVCSNFGTTNGSYLAFRTSADTTGTPSTDLSLERLRIDSSGRLLVGTSTAGTARVGIQGTTGNSTYAVEGLNVAVGGNTVNPNGRGVVANFEAGGGGDPANTYGATISLGASSVGAFGIRVVPGAAFAISDYYPGNTYVGASNPPTERLRIDSSGRVGIGTASPSTYVQDNGLAVYRNANNSQPNFNVVNASTSGSAASVLQVLSGGGSCLISATSSGWGDYGILKTASTTIESQTNWLSFGAPNGFIFGTGANPYGEKMRIDSSGRLLVGTSSARSNLYNNGYVPSVQFETSGALTERGLSLAHNGGTSTGGPLLAFITSRGTTAGSNTIVASGDELGGFNFLGADGTKPIGGAAITAYVDGTPGANDMPGRLVFSTTADGSATPTERMRISNAGYLLLFNRPFQAYNTGGSYDMGGTGSGVEVFAGLEVGRYSYHMGAYVNGGSSGPIFRETEYSDWASPATIAILHTNGSIFNSAIQPGADNTYTCGTSGARWSAIWSANGTIQTSDKRDKTEIQSILSATDFIKKLNPITYKWKVGGHEIERTEDGAPIPDEEGNPKIHPVPGSRTHWGFASQEVKTVIDELGIDFGGWVLTDKDNPESQQALRYDQFIAPLTKALQEAIAKIETLEARLTAAGIE